MRCEIGVIQKISRKIGFTETEVKIILFLITSLIIGISVEVIKESRKDKNLLQFDYSKEDSLFNNYETAWEFEDSAEKIIEKGVDSKRELLDFNGAKFAGNKVKSSGYPAEIVDINKASVNELTSLPGIGQKTAEAIVEYRKRNGDFKKVDEIKNVKGIGKAKFEKISKYIIVK